MQYYPKSQIKTNLYTNGAEFSLYVNSQNFYTGYYYKISTGKVYSGKNPSDPSTKPLYPPSPFIEDQKSFPSLTYITLRDSFRIEGVDEDKENLDFTQYNSISNSKNFISRLVPTTNPTHPTEQDKQNGYFTRYFCKKNNELKYIEISKDMFTKLNSKDSQAAWDLYTPVSIKWIIKGDINVVNATNSTNVNIAARNNNFNGFNQFFKSYSQYYVGTSYKPTNSTSTNLTNFPPNPSRDGGY
jgi:hypothetical protein